MITQLQRQQRDLDYVTDYHGYYYYWMEDCELDESKDGPVEQQCCEAAGGTWSAGCGFEAGTNSPTPAPPTPAPPTVATWNPSGCIGSWVEKEAGTDGVFACSCNHLTHFAVISTSTTTTPVDCVLGLWETTFYSCSTDCNRPRGTILSTREVLVHSVNGGLECGDIAETSQCPEVDPAACVFDASSSTTVSIKVAVSASVYDKYEERVATVLKDYLRKDVFLENGPRFKLEFGDAVVVEGEDDLVKIDVDVITNAAEVTQHVVELTLKAANAESVMVMHEDPNVARLKGMISGLFGSEDVFNNAEINQHSALLPSNTMLAVMKSFLRLGWKVVTSE